LIVGLRSDNILETGQTVFVSSGCERSTGWTAE
jgi:hypothetical protein